MGRTEHNRDHSWRDFESSLGASKANVPADRVADLGCLAQRARIAHRRAVSEKLESDLERVDIHELQFPQLVARGRMAVRIGI